MQVQDADRHIATMRRRGFESMGEEEEPGGTVVIRWARAEAVREWRMAEADRAAAQTADAKRRSEEVPTRPPDSPVGIDGHGATRPHALDVSTGEPVVVPPVDVERALDAVRQARPRLFARSARTRVDREDHSLHYATVSFLTEREYDHWATTTFQPRVGSPVSPTALDFTAPYKSEAAAPDSIDVEDCSACSGNGEAQCPTCHGRGEERCPPEDYCGSCGGSGLWHAWTRDPCPACAGTGREICTICRGTGFVRCADCAGAGFVACKGCAGGRRVFTFRLRGIARDPLVFTEREVDRPPRELGEWPAALPWGVIACYDGLGLPESVPAPLRTRLAQRQAAVRADHLPANGTKFLGCRTWLFRLPVTCVVVGRRSIWVLGDDAHVVDDPAKTKPPSA